MNQNGLTYTQRASREVFAEYWGAPADHELVSLVWAARDGFEPLTTADDFVQRQVRRDATLAKHPNLLKRRRAVGPRIARAKASAQRAMQSIRIRSEVERLCARAADEREDVAVRRLILLTLAGHILLRPVSQGHIREVLVQMAGEVARVASLGAAVFLDLCPFVQQACSDVPMEDPAGRLRKAVESVSGSHADDDAKEEQLAIQLTGKEVEFVRKVHTGSWPNSATESEMNIKSRLANDKRVPIERRKTAGTGPRGYQFPLDFVGTPQHRAVLDAAGIRPDEQPNVQPHAQPN